MDGAKEQRVLASHDVIFMLRTALANANLEVRQYIKDLLPFSLPWLPRIVSS
jgi:hypothetical protein